MQLARIGDFEVHRVAEFEGPFFPPADFFPDFDPEVVRANADRLGPQLIDPATGKLIFSFHTFIVKTGHHTVLIDEEDMQGYLDLLIHSQDEPIADWVCIPLYFVSKLARDSGTTVIQVGEGSDEQFCGYAGYMTSAGVTLI